MQINKFHQFQNILQFHIGIVSILDSLVQKVPKSVQFTVNIILII